MYFVEMIMQKISFSLFYFLSFCRKVMMLLIVAILNIEHVMMSSFNVPGSIPDYFHIVIISEVFLQYFM